MKPQQFKIPFPVRVIFFIVGLGAAWLPLNAIRTGMINAGDHGVRVDIIRAQDPVFFWALVIAFSVVSLILLCGAFVKGRRDT
jgi:hypothetical protein